LTLLALIELLENHFLDRLDVSCFVRSSLHARQNKSRSMQSGSLLTGTWKTPALLVAQVPACLSQHGRLPVVAQRIQLFLSIALPQ
jgi:hypothetical protein